MDIYSTSFTVARTPKDIDALLLTALSAHGCSISHYPLPPSSSSSASSSSNFSISGSPTQVLHTRALLLSHSPPVVRSSLKVPRSLILDMPFSSSPSLNQVVRAHLDEIASNTLAHIAVVNSPVSSRGVSMPISKDALGSGLETERLCELVISAEEDAVDLARVRLLVMLDELSGLHSESLEIEHKLLPIIAGRKRSTLQSIQEETATNIYYPSPLQHPPSSSSSTDSPKNKNTLWITGEFFGVQRARDMLFQIAAQKSTSLLSKDTALLPRKLDFLLLHHSDDLKSLMADTASYIHLPPLGSSTPLVTIYSDSRVNVTKAMRGVMQLITQFFIASYWLLPTHFNTLLPPTTSALQLSLALNKPLPHSASPFPPPPPFSSTTTSTNASSNNSSGPPGTGPGPGSSTNAQSTATPMTTLLQQISIASGAEVVFKGMCFEMHGLEPQVRKAVGMIMELDVVKSFHHEVRFQLELSNEHRDFISGKKNGKINKITQSFSSPSSFPQSSSSTQPPLSIPSHLPPQQPPKIKFETLNDSNFLIDLSSPSPITSLSALTLLMEELPAEISFHVPEVYHKRIIGVGGRSIQRIMKRFGVYVKFLSGEEVRGGGLGVGMNMGMSMSNGGVKQGTVVGDRYTDRDWEMEDNVVARTPAKNAINLEHLKVSVMELVAPKDKDFTTETLSIPRRYHRTLLGEKGIFIHDIEQKTNSRVRFPDKESGSDVVVIYGPESQVGITAAMLLDHVPFEADMILPPHPDLPRVTCSAEFNNLVEHIKRELQVSIVPNFKRLSSSSTGSPSSANKNLNGAASTNAPSPAAPTTRESPTDITQPQTQQQQHPSDYTFKFRCQRSNTDFLPTAREMLEQFLIKHHVFGYPPSTSTSGTTTSASTATTTTITTTTASSTGTNTGPSSATATSPSSVGTTHRRTDSFADAFPHFESRVLAASNVGSSFGSVLSRTRGHESMDMGRPDLSLLTERRLRMANSSPDVKALFNAPAYIYNLEALEAASSVGSGDDLGYAESYEGGGYAGSSGEGAGTTGGGGESELDYWTPTSLVPISSTAPTRTRQAHDALKRGSDSLLEAKIKEQHQMQMQSNKTRSLTNRAQSLDLTHSLALARISESGSGSGHHAHGATGGGGSGSGHASASGSPSLGNVGLGGGSGAYAGYSQLQRYYQQQIPHEQEYEYEHEHGHDGTAGGGGMDYPDSPRTAGTTSTTTGSNSGSTSMSFGGGGGVGDEPVFEFAGGSGAVGNGVGVEDPTTTTQPSFPSVYAPPNQHSHSHSHSGSARSSGVFGASSSASSGGYGNGSALGGGGGGWMTSDHHQPQQQQQQQQYSHFYHHHHLSHGSHHFSQQQAQQQPQTHRHTASSSAIPLRTSGLGLGSGSGAGSTRSKEEEESVDQMSRVMSNLGL